MTSLKFSSEAEDAVKDVRNDDTPTNWVALTYAEGCMFLHICDSFFCIIKINISLYTYCYFLKLLNFWFVFYSIAKENIVLLATGNGDADELKEKAINVMKNVLIDRLLLLLLFCRTDKFLSFQDDKVVYALVRVKEVIDQSTTIKFVFVNWVGEKVYIKIGLLK
jgi:hypothetical protein